MLISGSQENYVQDTRFNVPSLTTWSTVHNRSTEKMMVDEGLAFALSGVYLSYITRFTLYHVNFYFMGISVPPVPSDDDTRHLYSERARDTCCFAEKERQQRRMTGCLGLIEAFQHTACQVVMNLNSTMKPFSDCRGVLALIRELTTNCNRLISTTRNAGNSISCKETSNATSIIILLNGKAPIKQ